MDFDWDQMLAVAILGAAAAVGLGVVFLASRLVRALLRWVVGANSANAVVEPEPAARNPSLPQPVCASDLFAVRSNLDAVSRQLEDLERKLRRVPVPAAPAKTNRRGEKLSLEPTS
jgi:hypothetical protein